MEPGFHRWEGIIDPNTREKWGDGFIHSHTLSCRRPNRVSIDLWGKFALSLRPGRGDAKWKTGPDGAEYKAVLCAIHRDHTDVLGENPETFTTGNSHMVFRREA